MTELESRLTKEMKIPEAAVDMRLHDKYNHQVSRLLAREICACTAWLNSLSFNYALFRCRIPCSISIRRLFSVPLLAC